jgi:hypothetical protein
MREHIIENLRMLGGGAKSSADHAANDDRRRGLASEHIAKFCGLVEDLVETHAHEIDEHQLGHRPQARGSRSNRRPNEP